MTELSERLATLSPAKRALLEKLRGAPPIPRAPDGPAPLSAEQRRLWYVLQLAPGYPVYTIPLGFRLRGPLDVHALLDALRDLVARHEMLRVAFAEQDGEPVQTVHDGSAFEPRRVEVEDDQWAASEARWQADDLALATFDLGAGETFRAVVVRVAEDEHHLLMAFHHLAVDGWSAAVLLRELSALYAARVAGESARLPQAPVRFRDWAAFQQRPREGVDADEAFWRAELQGAPHVLELPADHPRPALQSWEGFKHPFGIAPELTEPLEAAARAEGTTLYVVFAAAFALLLSRYAGEEDFLVGTLLANRPRPELADVVGFFANTVPLRMRMHGDPTLGELIRRVHGTVTDAQRHGALPFDRIVELADIRRDFSRPPLVQAVLTFADGPASSLAIPGVEVERIEMDSRTAIFDLTLQVERHGAALAAALQVPGALFDEETARRMARHLRSILAAIAADRAQPVSRVALADEEEVAQVAAWSDGGAALLEDGVIHHLFETQARERPFAAALVHGHADVPFGELNRRANRVAHGLIAAGVQRGECVGVCMARTPALVAAILGILKAGAAYVPMDPAHPAPRHRAALSLSGARRVITDAASRAALGELPESVTAATVAEVEAEREDDPVPRAGPGDLAYVIFTSGSTGGPKGVAIEHRASAAMLAWVRALLGDDRAAVLGSTAITFDVSVGELLGTLCCGGTVVLVENALAGLPRGRRVHAAPMTPTAASELLREGHLPAGARTLLLGGEAVPPPLVGALAEAGVPRIVNLWGPDGRHHVQHLGRAGAGERPRGHRPADPRRAGVRAGFAAAPRGDRRAGGGVDGGCRGGARVRVAPGAYGGEVRPGPVRRARSADVPHAGPRPLARGRHAGVPGPHGRAGEGARPPHRAGRGGAGAGRASIHRPRRRRRAGRRCGGAAAGRLPGRAPGRRAAGGRGAARLPPRAAAGVHGPRRVRVDGGAAADGERQAGPPRAP